VALVLIFSLLSGVSVAFRLSSRSMTSQETFCLAYRRRSDSHGRDAGGNGEFLV
jgi:hypothetical protein